MKEGGGEGGSEGGRVGRKGERGGRVGRKGEREEGREGGREGRRQAGRGTMITVSSTKVLFSLQSKLLGVILRSVRVVESERIAVGKE